MKKTVILAMTGLVALSLVCIGGLTAFIVTSAPKDGGDVPEITDFRESGPQRHEPIAKWEPENGEVLENPYYKRQTDENGDAVYALRRASDGQMVYLPIGSTVLYTGGEASYYEEIVLSYTQDGEEKEITQYQLHIEG